MADLAFIEDCFFETPPDVAEELASLTCAHIGTFGALKVVDACAGAGALAHAFLRTQKAPCDIAIFETNPRLVAKAHEGLAGVAGAPIRPIDIFSSVAERVIEAADVTLMNPPFGGIRGDTWGPRFELLQDQSPQPDIGCHYVLHVASLLKPGAILALIYRRNAFVSRSYRPFRAQLSSLGAVVDYVDVQRRLRPGSGAAEAVLVIFRKGAITADCWLRRREADENARESKLLTIGWRRLGSVASVRAGPSIRSELKSMCGRSAQIARVLAIPACHDGDTLWGPDFQFDMDWHPEAFSVPRNLGWQGRPGFAYKLAASEFRTAILPDGYHFTSATPAVLPRRPYDLNFVTGCALLNSWRKLVRDWVDSSNFTPSAVEDVFVPYCSYGLYRAASRIGGLARELLRPAVRRKNSKALSIPERLMKEIQLLSDELETEIG